MADETPTTYDSMKYCDLRVLYAERCGFLGVEKPVVPAMKKDLITMLNFMDVFGVPKDPDTKPDESIRQAICSLLEKGLANTPSSDPLFVIVAGNNDARQLYRPK